MRNSFRKQNSSFDWFKSGNDFGSNVSSRLLGDKRALRDETKWQRGLLVTSCQLGFLILFCYICFKLFDSLRKHPTFRNPVNAFADTTFFLCVLFLER